MQIKKKLDTQETRDAPRQTKENIYMKPQDADKKKFEVPKQVSEPEDEWSSKGCIEFSYGIPTSLNNTSLLFRPQVGDFYIFPGWLNHTVYPFEGDGRRRCFSMNLIMSIEST